MADGFWNPTGLRGAPSDLVEGQNPRDRRRNEDMKNTVKTSTSSVSPAATDVAGKTTPKKPLQDEPRAAVKTDHKIDRPGFDLGGSSGDTHAGAGLGLGEDAFDTARDRRLPGRQLENKLTIPRWSGPEPRDPTASVKRAVVAKNPSTPETKKAR